MALGTVGEDGSAIVGKILDKDQYSFGFDGQTGEYGNLVTKGIIDPTKVVRVAIQNAASVAALLITTEAMVKRLGIAAGPFCISYMSISTMMAAWK